MKRDLDLVRSILIYVEKADGPVDANDLVDGANDFNKVSYHVMLMANRGLLDLLSFQQDVNHDVTDLYIAGGSSAVPDSLVNSLKVSAEK